MILEPEQAIRFFHIHKALLQFVNLRLKVVKPPKGVNQGVVALSEHQRIKVRDALAKQLGLIQEFVDENPYLLEDRDLEVARSWTDMVIDEFLIIRHLKKHTIFLGPGEDPLAYGVLGLTEPIVDVIGWPLPYHGRAALLPFEGQIIYDGVFLGTNAILGRNMTREFENLYKQSKARHGLVTSLPYVPAAKAQASKSKPKASKRKPRKEAPLAGRWRITWMEQWEQEFVDEEVEGYLEFKARGGFGEFQFGYVSGQIDSEPTERDGRPAIEFSWIGNDEMDEASGRGWAVLDANSDNEIHGRFYLHGGDSSAFRAVRRS